MYRLECLTLIEATLSDHMSGSKIVSIKNIY